MTAASTSASVSLHAGFLAMLLLLGSRALPPAANVKPLAPIFVPHDLVTPRPKPTTAPPGGGNGGGAMPLPDARGMLPRPSPRVFVPPAQVLPNPDAALLIEPTLDVKVDIANPPQPQWGNPLAQVGPPSNGTGRRGGIGPGDGGRIGNTPGTSYGPGGPGPAGGVYTIGRGVTAPQLVHKTEPEYAEEARKVKYQGSVLLRIVVDDRGLVRDVIVSSPLGMGLDEKAIEAVRKWRFRPGTRDGKAVPVWAAVEVMFRLL